jgi:Transposase DDE domain
VARVRHDEVELELLLAVARQRLAAGQGELDLGLDGATAGTAGAPLAITSSRMGHLWDTLCQVYDWLEFDVAAGGDRAFRDLVLARVIEPTRKLEALRVPSEVGIGPASYATVNRRLRLHCAEGWRDGFAAACAAHAGLGSATFLLYDVTTLHFETDAGDGFRESGFSKERRLEPQITVGLLTDADGFPLMVQAFEGNTAETTTILPTLRAFMTSRGLSDVVIVADAGMFSDANKKAVEAEGLSFILRARTPHVPYLVEQWHGQHPGQQIPDGHVFTHVDAE